MRLNYFNFKPFGNQFLLTNDFGSYLFVSPGDFKQILTKKVDLNSDLGQRLLEKNMVFDETNLEYSSRMKHGNRQYHSVCRCRLPDLRPKRKPCVNEDRKSVV